MKRKLLVCLSLMALVLPLTLHAGQDLENLKSIYNKTLSQITDTQKAFIDIANQKYLELLRALFAKTATKDGDFVKSKALQEEDDRFEKDKNITKAIIEKSFPELQKLQSAYLEKLVVIERENATKIITLTEQYENSLKLLLQNLTKQLKLDDASEVQSEIDGIKKNEIVVRAKQTIADCRQPVESAEKKADEKPAPEQKAADEQKNVPVAVQDKKAVKVQPKEKGDERFSNDEIMQNSVDYFFNKIGTTIPGRHYYAVMWALSKKCELQEELREEILSRSIKLLKKDKDPKRRIQYIGVMTNAEGSKSSIQCYKVVLDAMTKDRDPEIRGFAAYSMLWFRDNGEAMNDLQKALENEKNKAVIKSIQATIESIQKCSK